MRKLWLLPLSLFLGCGPYPQPPKHTVVEEPPVIVEKYEPATAPVLVPLPQPEPIEHRHDAVPHESTTPHQHEPIPHEHEPIWPH
jgi:hypothetical protein